MFLLNSLRNKKALLINAIIAGNLDQVKFYIEEQNVPLNAVSSQNKYLTSIAANHNQYDIFCYLIRQGAPLDSSSTDKKLSNYIHFFITTTAPKDVITTYDITHFTHAATLGKHYNIIDYFANKETLFKDYIEFAKLSIRTAVYFNDDKALLILLFPRWAPSYIILYLIKYGLCEAIRHNREQLIVDYIRHLDQLSPQRPPLQDLFFYAIQEGDVQIVETLIIKFDISPTDQDNHYSSPIRFAVTCGKVEVIKSLEPFLQDTFSNFHVVLSLCRASIKHDHLAVFMYLEEKYANFGPSTYKELICTAMNLYRIDFVKYFIQKKKIDINVRLSTQTTLLMYAIEHSFGAAIDFLIKEGIDINAISIVRETALFYAVAKQRYDIIKYLVQNNAKINMRDLEGHTVMTKAILANNIKMIKLLHELKADLYVLDVHENTLLHVGVPSLGVKAISYLLKNGININAKNNFGRTALHLAITSNRYSLLKYLIDKGADTTIIDFTNQTLLATAVMYSYYSIVILIEQGVDPHAESDKGASIALCAVQYNNTPLLKKLLNGGTFWQAPELFSYEALLGLCALNLDISNFSLIISSIYTNINFYYHDTSFLKYMLKHSKNPALTRLVVKAGAIPLDLCEYTQIIYEKHITSLPNEFKFKLSFSYPYKWLGYLCDAMIEKVLIFGNKASEIRDFTNILKVSNICKNGFFPVAIGDIILPLELQCYIASHILDRNSMKKALLEYKKKLRSFINKSQNQHIEDQLNKLYKILSIDTIIDSIIQYKQEQLAQKLAPKSYFAYPTKILTQSINSCKSLFW